jgi:acyl-CoA thioesterase-1
MMSIALLGDCPNRRTILKLAAGTTAALLASPALRVAAQDPPQDNAKETPLARIQRLLKGKEALTWVFTGDSITHGALHTRGWRSYPEHFAERVRWELRRMRDVVINTGISGDRTGGLLADLDWRVLRFKPHVASIMLGMNDCVAGEKGRETFRKNLTSIVERVKAGGATPLLHTPNTIYAKKAASRGDLPAYAKIVREIAQAGSLPLVDHFAHWMKQKPSQEALLPWLEDESIHPNVYGHREFAKLTFQELGIFDAKSPTCALEVP